MLNQKLQQKLQQKLSPQQIQLIKLLEVPTIQLEQRIKKEIEENPVLEEGAQEDEDFGMNNQEEEQPSEEEKEKELEEFSLEDYMQDEDYPSYKLSANNHSKDDKHTDIPYSQGNSFHEYLLEQLGLQILNESEQELAEYLIGNIDEDGYLRREIDAIVDDIAFTQNVITTEEEVLRILKIIQNFDPAGIGARDLQECLLLQLNAKLKRPQNSFAVRLAKEIIRDHFDEFSKKHYEKITNRLNVNSEELKQAVEEILRLNPKPGGAHGSAMNKNAQHITPDFILEENNGQLVLALNSKNIPELRVSATYQSMLSTYQSKKDKPTRSDKEAITFVKQKLDSAKWFIDAIRQRQNTLMHTMESILDYQREYFHSGDETKMRPMILKDIAERTNLDISTISRVANSKYIQTPFGIFPLKYFFSEGMQTDTGEEVSTREIKKILQDCIAVENKKKPLTDEKLAKILQEKGYQIARRTVAKYREQLGILVARLRKEL